MCYGFAVGVVKVIRVGGAVKEDIAILVVIECIELVLYKYVI